MTRQDTVWIAPLVECAFEDEAWVAAVGKHPTYADNRIDVRQVLAVLYQYDARWRVDLSKRAGMPLYRDLHCRPAERLVHSSLLRIRGRSVGAFCDTRCICDDIVGGKCRRVSRSRDEVQKLRATAALDDRRCIDPHAEITFDGPLERQLWQAAQDDARTRRRPARDRIHVGRRSPDVDYDGVSQSRRHIGAFGDEPCRQQHGARRRDDVAQKVQVLVRPVDALGVRDAVDEEVSDDVVDRLRLDAIDLREEILRGYRSLSR